MNISEYFNTIDRLHDIKVEKQYIEETLLDFIKDFEGNLYEAITIGLVKPNFPVAPGFSKMINTRRFEYREKIRRVENNTKTV